jgi:hypothetical protein
VLRQRSTSSIASGISDGSATSSARWSGFSAKASRAFDSTLAVVS